MKKLVLILTTLLSINMLSFANDAALFNYDESTVKQELTEATALETFIADKNVTLTDLKNAPSLSLNNFNTVNPLSPPFELDDMDWKAAFWGWCCWPIGLLVVHPFEKGQDKNTTISFIIGLGVSIATTIASTSFWYLRY